MYGLYLEMDEIIQITISVIAISLAMGIVFAGSEGLFSYPLEFMFFFAPIAVTVGSGFILHEMAHKLVAIYYGAKARFEMWAPGLLFMLASSFFGILLAAPGAVRIYADRISKRQNGIISIAGPAMNIALAIFFISLHNVAPIRHFFSFLAVHGTDYLGFGIGLGVLSVWKFGAAINVMLALFNMIPAFPLDGSKVLAWNWLVWLGVVGAFLLFGAVLISPGIVIGWGIMLLLFLVLSKILFG